MLLSMAMMGSLWTGIPAMPADAAANDVQIIDLFGREISGYGIDLVDWQGYLANPYIKLTVKAPTSAVFPVTVTVKAQGSSRLMMDLPSSLSATGATKTLTFADSSQQKDFKLEIAPDRVGGPNEIENYTLSLVVAENNGTSHTQNVPIRVLDQDDNVDTSFPLLFDYRFDTINHYFDNADYRAATERAIKDWFYFFDVQPFDTVPIGAEQGLVVYDNFQVDNDGYREPNNVAYNGEWIILRGINGPYSTGWASGNGQYHKRNGVQVPGPIHRSLGAALDFYDNAVPFTSLNDNDWYLTDLNQVTDVYGLMVHEFGHGVAFSDPWAGMVAYHDNGGIDPEVVAYQGQQVPIDNSYHIPGDQMYWDRLSGQSAGWTSFFPTRRWMLNKLTLLVAENAGWKLNKSLTPFLAPSIVTTVLPAGTKGQPYSQKLEAKGGVPFYDWTITSGTLPAGLSLNRFTGTISGTVSNSQPQSSYAFTVQLRDYDAQSAPVTKSFTISTGAITPTPTNIASQGTSTTSFVSAWESLAGLNDGYNVAGSNDRGHPVYGNWNNPGTTQWVQYDFSSNKTLSKTEVYWFDDNQGIDTPASCSIQYWNGSAWANVASPSGLGVLGNQYNATTFTPVTTNKIRLNITAKAGFSTGIEQWRVFGY
ncbi:Ig domain-containing protein [Cohnella suwonensis]|uniref:Ig domain-containing protein n=1 Tax=Cohnella suwonensis TaxID=696072 RepID=A0ABW0LUP6_9BACL